MKLTRNYLELIGIEYRFKDEYENLANMGDGVVFTRQVSPYYEGQKWAVRLHGYCLSKKSNWIYERSPSGRTDSFYGKCRFDSLEEAIAAYNKLPEKSRK
jgi:hypothetical protein